MWRSRERSSPLVSRPAHKMQSAAGNETSLINTLASRPAHTGRVGLPKCCLARYLHGHFIAE